MEEVLDKDQLDKEISNLQGWEKSEDKIEKAFDFKDFRSAIEFVNKVADIAESANHHPEIGIDYNKVEIELSTHSAGGVTQKDIELAGEIEKIK